MKSPKCNCGHVAKSHTSWKHFPNSSASPRIYSECRKCECLQFKKEQRCGDCRWWTRGGLNSGRGGGSCLKWKLPKNASNNLTAEIGECWEPKPASDIVDCIDCGRPLIIGDDVFCKRCLILQKNNPKLQKLLRESKPLR